MFPCNLYKIMHDLSKRIYGIRKAKKIMQNYVKHSLVCKVVVCFLLPVLNESFLDFLRAVLIGRSYV